jgi:hypothetical protein
VVERHPGATEAEISALKNRKFLVPFDMTGHQFLYVLQQQLHLRASQSVYLFVEDSQGGKSTYSLLKLRLVVQRHMPTHFSLCLGISPAPAMPAMSSPVSRPP